MDSKAAMEIGMKIAEQHSKNVLQIAELNGDRFGLKDALHGCMVSLAADIMVAVQNASANDKASV